MTSIAGIPTTRVSDLFIRERLLDQMQLCQTELFRVQNQLSTGRRFEVPSDDPVAALRVIDLQRLLERKEQVRNNATTTQSYLSATDTALANVSSLIAEIRGTAQGVIGTTASDLQRATAAQQVQQAIDQLMDTGNQKFRGRYLFAGSTTTVRPFQMVGGDAIEYTGNEQRLSSYADIDLLFDSNMHGSEVFGAISDVVQAGTDLDPILTEDTRLADLRGGQGISLGSIAVSDGGNSSIIDVSTAETIGDLAALIRANPPEGNSLIVEITATKLIVQLGSGSGDLSIREVGGGTTANELGILAEFGVGTSPVEGRDLDPILRPTTRLNDMLGVRARTVVRSTGTDNDLILEANTRGAELNDVTIQFENTAPARGLETVDWDGSTVTVGIKNGASTARDVIDAINADPTVSALFTARIDSLDEQNDGEGIVDLSATGVTSGGNGTEFDQDSGLQIVNGRETHAISLQSAETIQDLLNILNGSGAGVLAEINEDATGINVRSRMSGTDFMIGENGGSTATQLGLRTFTENTRLEALNFGQGIECCDGPDFTIHLTDGTELEIDLTTEETVGEVLDLINATAGGALQAQLARYGNGIELMDENTGPDTLAITQHVLSQAATGLGLVSAEEGYIDLPVPGQQASDVYDDGSDINNELLISANIESWDYNGVTLNVHDDGAAVGHVPVLSYNPDEKILDIEIENGVTTANDVITELSGTPVLAGLFTITNYGGSDGTGSLSDADPNWQVVSLSGGQPETLTGTDINPQETQGVFTALLRLKKALENNDLPEAQRAIDLLDQASTDLNFARAQLGARQQSLEAMQDRLDTEETELQAVLSLEFDADLVEVISNLTAKQATVEASLRSASYVLQTSLLNYL